MSMNANNWKRYGDIKFEYGIKVSSFLVDVSELLWGDATCPDCEDVYNCNCENRREPYTTEEALERLKEFSDKALAWDKLERESLEEGFADDNLEWHEIMESRLEEVKEE